MDSNRVSHAKVLPEATVAGTMHAVDRAIAREWSQHAMDTGNFVLRATDAVRKALADAAEALALVHSSR